MMAAAKTDRKESIILYGSQLDMLSELPGEDFKRFILDIYDYSLTGTVPDFSGYENGLAVKMAYKAVSYQVDRDKQAYSEACDRQRERARKRWEGNKKTDENANTAESKGMPENATACHGIKMDAKNAEQEQEQEQDNDKNKYMSGKPDGAPLLMPTVKEVVDYLNAKAGTHYRANVRQTADKVKARLNDGFTVEDFKKVIDIKTAEWMGTEWQKFIRPETLFGAKFESYLNQRPAQKKNTAGKFANFEQRNDPEHSAMVAQLIAMQ